MPKIKTTEEFIKELNIIWKDNNYDYSHVNYISSKDYILVICYKHGNFEIRATNHLQGRGCKKCQYENNSVRFLKTTIQFIEESNEVHGNRYDYSQSEYIGAHKKMIIICNIHGMFKQTPDCHINKRSGCPKCGIVQRIMKRTKTNQTFISESNEVHGNRYDYSNCEYLNDSTHVTIICKIHGEYLQTPSQHLQGHGCKLCGHTLVGLKKRI